MCPLSTYESTEPSLAAPEVSPYTNLPSAATYSPKAAHPALLLICTDPDHYPPPVLAQLVQRIEQVLGYSVTLSIDRNIRHVQTDGGMRPIPTIQPATVKQLLRSLHDPHTLAAQPLWTGNHCPEDWGHHVSQVLRRAIAELESPCTGSQPDLRGTILRMRYLERRRAKTVIACLHVSERHYHRLHADGLGWIASRLSELIREQAGKDGSFMAVSALKSGGQAA